MDDACNHDFQSASITGGANTYTNVVTNNGMSSEPTVGSKIYIGTTQGFEESMQDQNTVSSTNPTLPNGTYAYLSGGHPEYMEKGQASAQTGTIYRVKILQGFVTESEICPVDFTALGGANDIDGFIPFDLDAFRSFCFLCFSPKNEYYVLSYEWKRKEATLLFHIWV